MRTKKYIIIIAALLFGQELCAQVYDIVERRNLWNTSNNVTGIRLDSITTSYAQAHFTYEHGNFVNYYEPKNSWNAGVIAKTLVHEKKYSMIGAVEFNHKDGKDMCGSMFINPGFYPVDILEFTPGDKKLQKYGIMGGIAVDVADNWRIGAKMDFKAANYSKIKDLRHSNYRLDFSIAPGVQYNNGNLVLGLAYVFGKNSEHIKAEEIGTSPDAYYAFLDKGLMFGAYEVWNGSGIHLAESGINRFPVKETTNGVSAQMQLGEFYVNIDYLRSVGTIGEKGTIWYKFPTNKFNVDLGYRIKRDSKMHLFRLNFVAMYQRNKESVIGKETENGVTITHIYGYNEIFQRDYFSINPSYEFLSTKRDMRFGAELMRLERESSQVYPSVYSQDLYSAKLYAMLLFRVGKFDLKPNLFFTFGDKKDKFRRVETDVETESEPVRLEDYYNIQNEFLTTPRLTASFGARYNFYKGLYTEINAMYGYAFNPKYIDGHYRMSGTLKLGYNF